MVKIVFSDVDGTLLNSAHQLTQPVKKAILALQRRGIPFVIVSARSPSGVRSIFADYGFSCPMICYSGALILDEHRRTLFHKGMEKPLANRIVRCIEATGYDATLCIYSQDQWFVKDKGDPRVITEEGIVKTSAREGTVDSAADPAISKILCMGEPEFTPDLEARLLREFPEVTVTKSSDSGLEIMAGGVTKAAAVETLCGLWNISPAEAAAFGDNYNDAEMLELVGQGYLMGNGPEALKARIPRHAPGNDQDGVAYVLSELGLV